MLDVLHQQATELGEEVMAALDGTGLNYRQEEFSFVEVGTLKTKRKKN